MKTGQVYWVTGLSGAGKTTIGKLLYEHIYKSNMVFLDGDILREVFGNDLGHSLEDRKKSGMRNARLCKLLSEQGIDVICCTISMFDDIRSWNRDNIENYLEIYIKVSMETLLLRDPKLIYSSVNHGKLKNVYGVDLVFEEPINPEIIINNDGVATPEQLLNQVIEKIEQHNNKRQVIRS